MTFDLRQDRIFGIEEAMRTAGILRAARVEAQNAILIVFPTDGGGTGGHVTLYNNYLKIYVFFTVCHVILNVYGPSFSNSSKHN